MCIRDRHMLLAAKDFYTQDCFAAKLMGLEPTEIVMPVSYTHLDVYKRQQMMSAAITATAPMRIQNGGLR